MGEGMKAILMFEGKRKRMGEKERRGSRTSK